MEQTDEAVEGEMILGRDRNTGIMKPFKGLLPMQFRRVKSQQRSLVERLTVRIEQPRRTTLARRDVF